MGVYPGDVRKPVYWTRMCVSFHVSSFMTGAILTVLSRCNLQFVYADRPDALREADWAAGRDSKGRYSQGSCRSFLESAVN